MGVCQDEGSGTVTARPMRPMNGMAYGIRIQARPGFAASEFLKSGTRKETRSETSYLLSPLNRERDTLWKRLF